MTIRGPGDWKVFRTTWISLVSPCMTPTPKLSSPNNVESSAQIVSTGASQCFITGNSPALNVSSLDRTNFVQDILSRTALEQYLALIRREWVHASALWSYHRELWAENGDALSRIYAGTGALNTSFTRSGKRTLAGMHF